MKLNHLTIEKMEIEDLEEVLDIEASSSLHPWSRDMFFEEMNNPFTRCFIIKREGIPSSSVMGFICFRNIGDESELHNICVHPQYRQMGIGKKLMQFYIDFCEKMEIKKFYLEVNASNHSAIHLYHLFSYQSSGMRKRFYQNKFDALLMLKKD